MNVADRSRPPVAAVFCNTSPEARYSPLGALSAYGMEAPSKLPDPMILGAGGG